MTPDHLLLDKQGILDILYHMRDKGECPELESHNGSIRGSHVGICCNISEFIDYDDPLDGYFYEAMCSWPSRGDSRVYPVEIPGEDAGDTYCKYNQPGCNMYDPETEYGRKRQDLIAHLITQMEKYEDD